MAPMAPMAPKAAWVLRRRPARDISHRRSDRRPAAVGWTYVPHRRQGELHGDRGDHRHHRGECGPDAQQQPGARSVTQQRCGVRAAGHRISGKKRRGVRIADELAVVESNGARGAQHRSLRSRGRPGGDPTVGAEGHLGNDMPAVRAQQRCALGDIGCFMQQRHMQDGAQRHHRERCHRVAGHRHIRRLRCGSTMSIIRRRPPRRRMVWAGPIG
jgi:hypothetical protein